MTATITADNGVGTTSPVAIPDVPSEDESRNLSYDLIDGGMAAVLRPPRPRSGNLELWYDTYAAREAARVLHRETTTFTITDPEIGLSMVYMVGTGGTRVSRQGPAWILMVSFQELLP